jgi:hypothetical protein
MNVCRAFPNKEIVNNSIAATEVEKNLYTDIWKNSDSVICCLLFFNTYTRTNDNIERRKIITRKEVTYIQTHKRMMGIKKRRKKKRTSIDIYIYK